MDRVDRAILAHLQARRAPDERRARRARAAQPVGVPAPRPGARGAGVIAGYHAVVDPAALDRGFQVLVYTTLCCATARRSPRSRTAVVGLDEVVECHRMFGDPDYVIRVAVADVERLRAVPDRHVRRPAGRGPDDVPVRHEDDQGRRAAPVPGLRATRRRPRRRRRPHPAEFYSSTKTTINGQCTAGDVWTCTCPQPPLEIQAFSTLLCEGNNSRCKSLLLKYFSDKSL